MWEDPGSVTLELNTRVPTLFGEKRLPELVFCADLFSLFGQKLMSRTIFMMMIVVMIAVVVDIGILVIVCVKDRFVID